MLHYVHQPAANFVRLLLCPIFKQFVAAACCNVKITLKRVVRLNQNSVVAEVNDRVWCLSFVGSLLRVTIFTLHSQFQKASHLEAGQQQTLIVLLRWYKGPMFPSLTDFLVKVSLCLPF